ncbi:MAG: outer membrane beta-barrel protein [Propylenella sp.]
MSRISALAWLLAPALVVAPFSAAAQPRPRADEVDFILRPGQAIDEEDEEDIWDWDTEPEPSLLESEIGPPLLGPAEGEEIGPALLGPDVPLEVRERVPREPEEDDPFAATGIRLGPFVIRPSIEIGVSATDNVALEEDGESAVGLVVAPAVNAIAEGDRHEIEIDLGGETILYEDEQFNTRDAFARIRGRYDLGADTTLEGEGGYTEFREDFSDPDTPGGAAERPMVRFFDATLGVEQRFGRLSLRPSAFVDRSTHEDVPLAGGGIASRRELDNTQYGGRLRTGVLLGAVTPFAEIAAGVRDYDQEIDDSGFERSSVWGELRGGLVIDRGEKLSGEVSIGFRREELKDSTLPEIDAVLANASILWSPTRLTEVQVDLSTDVQSTSVPDESGSVLYSSLVTISRRITPRIRIAGGGGVDYEYSVGGDWEDVTFTGFAEASYAFNRTASVQARYSFEALDSSEDGGDYQAHIVSVRLRLQR